MEVKELVDQELQVQDDGKVMACAIGVAGLHRGIDMTKVDVYDYRKISKLVNIAESMVREIEYENDEGSYTRHNWFMKHQGDCLEVALRKERECRWQYVRAWVDARIKREGEDWIYA